MNQEEEPEAGIPEWVVTFGDMMSLLLTFFIMLVSMSEIKEDEKYQALVDSMRREFGHEASRVTIPGDNAPRNSNMLHVASAGRSKRRDLMRGGAKVKAVVGDNPKAQRLRPGKHAVNAGIINFGEHAVDFSDDANVKLQQAVKQMVGKPQRIEIRGHTTRRPLPADSTMRDHWDLAYERCRQVRDFLVQQGIDPDRIQLRVAGSNEPIYNGTDPDKIKDNARVELFMWDERLGDSSQ